jgi:hypothetical protein
MKTTVYTPDGTRKAMLYKTGLTIHGEDFMVEKQKRLYVFYVRNTFVASRGKREASLEWQIKEFERKMNTQTMKNGLTKNFLDTWVRDMREKSERVDKANEYRNENKTQTT